jgi:hypothetical protein
LFRERQAPVDDVKLRRGISSEIRKGQFTYGPEARGGRAKRYRRPAQRHGERQRACVCTYRCQTNANQAQDDGGSRLAGGSQRAQAVERAQGCSFTGHRRRYLGMRTRRRRGLCHVHELTPRLRGEASRAEGAR